MRVCVCTLTISSSKQNMFFNSILNNLNGKCKFVVIDSPLKLKQIINSTEVFDWVVIFSYYAIPMNSDIWKHRQMCESIPHIQSVYIESPILNDIHPRTNKFRLSVGSPKFYLQKNNITYTGVIHQLKPVKTTGDILFLLQNPGQYFLNMSPKSYNKYINSVIRDIRNYCTDKIIIRYKPADKNNYSLLINDPINNYEISTVSLHADCARSRVCIAHSTIAVVVAVFEGLSIFSLSDWCIAHEIADHSLEKLNSPTVFDRTQFCKKLYSCAYNCFDLERSFYTFLTQHAQTL